MPLHSSFLPDQSHINKVRDALWNRPDSGATVMVGSGFSRNAAKTRPDAADPPLWTNIAKEIAKELYPGSASVGANGTNDRTIPPDIALRLAQEYQTGFGRSELHRLLEGLIRDDHFAPGEIHSRLLYLPWRDVFTTNWDTLLERASLNIAERAYTVVQDMSQLPLLNQPRIVKLHGSLPATFPLISTEEDYRTYPAKFAPFVNTVQQAMMETVFLLVGFSGDDPNFLNWAGWVRDNLGDSAPKIYLAGWLDLSPHRRRMLEDRGVVPVDLALHPKANFWPEQQRHKFAAEWILHTLERGQPYDRTTWPSMPIKEERPVPNELLPVDELVDDVPLCQPARKRSANAPFSEYEPLDRVKLVLDTWAHNRKLYPGWLAFPTGQERWMLSHSTDEWEPVILNALSELGPVERLNGIRELLWRRDILLEPLTPDLESASVSALELIDCRQRTIEGVEENREDWADIRDAWRTVAVALVTAARIDAKEELFWQRLESVAPFANDAPDIANRIHQERCLWASYSLDFEDLNWRLDSWDVENCAPIWMVRKAALLTEALRFEESRTLIQRALRLIRRGLAGDFSIAAASREGWALVSTMTLNNTQAVFRRWNELASLKCHAGLELDNLRRALLGTEDGREAPRFELGTRRGPNGRVLGNRHQRIISAYRAIRLPEVVGLAPRNNLGRDELVGMESSSGILSLAAEELVAENPELAIRLALRVCRYDRDKMLQRVVSRATIGALAEHSVLKLAQMCIGVIHYALPRVTASVEHVSQVSWVERLRVAMEVLSRLVLRLPPDTAKTVLDVGLVCYKTPQVVKHVWLDEPLNSLLRRAWEALPKYCRADSVFDLLGAPVVGMEGFEAHSRLQDPGGIVSEDDLPPRSNPEYEHRFREVVDFLIRALQARDSARNHATIRLLSLSISENLTDPEKSEIANALWRDHDPVLENTSGPNAILDWVYLILPEMEPYQAAQSFRRKWLTPNSSQQEERGTFSSEMLAQVGVAVGQLRSFGFNLELSGEEQEHILSNTTRLVESLASGSVAMHLDFNSTITGMRALLAEVEISQNAAEDLFNYAELVIGSPHDGLGPYWFQDLDQIKLAVAFGLTPGLARALPDRIDRIGYWVRTGLASDDDLRISSAIAALRFWTAEAETLNSTLPPPADDLILEVAVIIASRRRVALADALWCATGIFGTRNHRIDGTISRLVLQGLAYLAEELNYDRDIHDRDEVPTLRLLCARLAWTLAQHEYGHAAPISEWLAIAETDPFPEVRNAVMPSK